MEQRRKVHGLVQFRMFAAGTGSAPMLPKVDPVTGLRDDRVMTVIHGVMTFGCNYPNGSLTVRVWPNNLRMNQ